MCLYASQRWFTWTCDGQLCYTRWNPIQVFRIAQWDRTGSCSIGSCFDLELPVGLYGIWLIAEDRCNNADSCYSTFTIRDCKKPTPYCHTGITTVVMPSTGNIEVWAKDLDAGSYDNCSDQGICVLALQVMDWHLPCLSLVLILQMANLRNLNLKSGSLMNLEMKIIVQRH